MTMTFNGELNHVMKVVKLQVYNINMNEQKLRT